LALQGATAGGSLTGEVVVELGSIESELGRRQRPGGRARGGAGSGDGRFYSAATVRRTAGPPDRHGDTPGLSLSAYVAPAILKTPTSASTTGPLVSPGWLALPGGVTFAQVHRLSRCRRPHEPPRYGWC
jgi:hypothetical protein